MRSKFFALILFSLLVSLLAGCSSGSPSGLPETSMRVGSKTYHLEIAADDASREHGLMERDAMDPDHGMIFIFPKPSVQNFWMRHTRFPLDIIFAGDDGKVLSVDTMKPYDETTPHESAGPAKYAIELNVGELASSGVKPGDKLQIPQQVLSATVH